MRPIQRFCIDYFATIGIKDGNLTPHPVNLIPNDKESKIVDIHDAWNDVITDIAVITDGESPDHSWEIIKKTWSGLELYPPHIAVRRRKYSRTMSHITEIQLIMEGAVIPKGYEIITKSISGQNSAYLNPIGFLAVKRAVNDPPQFVKESSSISSIHIILESELEFISEESSIVETINRAGAPATKPSVYLAYSKLPPIGLSDLVYDCYTIDRYPQNDEKGSELPANELPMFGFPHGLKLHYGSAQKYPLPSFFTFVFTNMNGEHFYAECLRFYEEINRLELGEIVKRLYGWTLEEMFQCCNINDGFGLFCPKVICVISRQPFYRAMRRLLRQIYSMSLSSLPCPLEFYIASLVHHVPLPYPGGRPYHFILDSGMISANSRSLPPIEFAMPPQKFFPFMDLDFAGPLRCLSVENILAVYALILRESKLVFICRSSTLLTETMETFRSLLFPLVWTSCFVSPLPDILSGLLEAPGGFMIGFHTSDNIVDYSNEVSSIKSSNHELQEQIWVQSLAVGTIIVDLSSNALLEKSRSDIKILSGATINDILKILPQGPKRRLQSRLQKIAMDYGLGPQKGIYFEGFDSAFEFHSSPTEDTSNLPISTFPTLEIRDIFMTFMIDLLGDYQRYISNLSKDAKEDSFRTFKEGFAVNEYIAAADSSMRHVIELLTETQMFASFLQLREEGNDYSTVFYEKIVSLYRLLDLSAGGHGDKIPVLSSHVIPEIPLPLYKLQAVHTVFEKTFGSWKLDDSVSAATPSTSNQTNLPSHQSSPIRVTLTSTSPTVSATQSPQRQQLVRNEYMSILLEFYTKSYEKLRKLYCWNDEAGTSNDLVRDEISKGYDIDLSNCTLGPFVIPGPMKELVQLHDMSNGPNSNEKDHDGQYTYRRSWPMLNRKYLELGIASTHSRLQDIKKASISSRLNSNRIILDACRTINERTLNDGSFSFDNRGTVTISPQPKGLSTAFYDGEQVRSVLVDIASMSILLLTSRILKDAKPQHDILQLLGILAQLEGIGSLKYMDECVWRSVLIACYSINTNDIKNIAGVVYDSMQEYHKSPDSLSYGRYYQCLIRKSRSEKVSILKSSDNALHISHLDQYHYLEEIGASWFFDHRISVILSLVDYNHQQRNSLSGTGSMSGSSSISNTLSFRLVRAPSVAVSENTSIGNKRVSKSSTKVETSSIVADQLSLKKATNFSISFYVPKKFIDILLPYHCKELVIVLSNINNTSNQQNGGNESNSKYASTIDRIKRRNHDICSDILTNRDSVSGNGSQSKPISPMNAMHSSQINKTRNSIDGSAGGRLSISPVTSSANALGRLVSGGIRVGMDSTVSLVATAAHSTVTVGRKITGKEQTVSTSEASVSRPSSWLPISWTMKSTSPIAPKTSNQTNPSTRSDSDNKRNSHSGGHFFSDDDVSEATDDYGDHIDNNEELVDKNVVDAIRKASSQSDTPMSIENAKLSEASTHLKEAEASSNDSDIPSVVVENRSEEKKSVNQVLVAIEEERNDSRNLLQLSHHAVKETSDGVTIKQNGVNNNPDSIGKDKISVTSLAETISHIIDNPDLNGLPDPSLSHMKESNHNFSYHNDDIQNDIYQLIEADLRHSPLSNNQIVGIHNQTYCLSCNSALLDEEILSAWIGASNASNISQSPRSRRRSLRSSHHISCPTCQQLIIPTLYITCYEPVTSPSVENVSGSIDSVKQFIDIRPVWKEEFEYYSPSGLRAVVEDVILRIGDNVCNPVLMHRYFPVAFWNLVWYSTRSSLPSGFLPLSLALDALSPNICEGFEAFWSELDDRRKERYMKRSSIMSFNYESMRWLRNPIVIGWREQTVRCKIIRIFSKLHQTSNHNDSINLYDIIKDDLSILFPNCCPSEITRLQAIGNNIEDGSWTGMREGILDICKLFKENPNILENFHSGSEVLGRNIYLSLLHITIAMNKEGLLCPASTSSSRVYGSRFDKCYSEAIKAVVTPEDTAIIGKTNDILLSSMPSEAARVLRLTLRAIL